MTLRLELRRSSVRLEPPLVNAGTTWERRALGCLELHELARGGARLSGRGEASPLPGYSPDDEIQVERALAALGGPELTRLAEASSAAEALAAVASALPDGSPAARFGLETALLDRLARAAGEPLWRVLAPLAGARSAAPGEPRVVALCALVPSRGPAAALPVAERCWAAGVRTFKLKIGPERLRPEQEATLEALRVGFGDHLGLRLDANGSLARAELRSTLARLARFAPELVEEPLADADGDELADSPCPLALDESLQRLGDDERERWVERTRAAVVVLKPTTLGGVAACLRLAAAARRLGRDVIVSHALEGPIGWSACAHLALALASPRAAGLWPLAHQLGGAPRAAQGQLLAPRAPGLGDVP